ncbi:hypothetical protein EDB83DRAFT_2552759 [Lactarius deliciosus]|nr:hypothetical protein EDB83DRAFT_2552759 [Lactarius deliciosus]
MIIDRSTAKRLAEILRDINVDDKDTIEKLSEDEQVADLGLSEGQTLLVRQSARAPELKEFKRYNKTILTQGMSPSEGAKLTNYCKTQVDDAQAIYDGQGAPDAGVSRISPPIQIFHPIFGDFIRSVNHPDSDAQPTRDDLKNREDIRQKCCCPTFLVATGGPWFGVLGGVFTDRFIVQPLTAMHWMVLSKREEDNQVYHSARVLVTLRNCLVKLQTFYRALESPSTFIANKPHPRYFPYPTSFTAEDEDPACVSYLAEIPNEPSTTRDSGPVKVVVKFVSRYGKEVHEFLACKGWAPTLRYCGLLPETEHYSVFPGPAQSVPSGLRGIFFTGPAQSAPPAMHMIVMDYIDALPNTPPDVRGQIRTILILLHAEGYVFGDLRKPNILFDAYGKVKPIDFDWCGRTKSTRTRPVFRLEMGPMHVIRCRCPQ